MGKIITETPIDEFISRFRHNADHQRRIGDLHGCLEFRQLADTLEKYQQIEQILDDCDLEAWEILEKVKEVIYNG